MSEKISFNATKVTKPLLDSANNKTDLINEALELYFFVAYPQSENFKEEVSKEVQEQIGIRAVEMESKRHLKKK